MALGRELCEMLGIEYPIFQGGMAWVATAPLVAAVSEAGGLGIIGSGGFPAEWVRDQIRRVRELTQKPFGVNVMLLSPHAEDIMRLLEVERVPVVTTGAGNPGKYIDKLKRGGTKIFPVVSSSALARRLERLGVDGIIAEGMESGGHIGEVTTMVLVPQVVDAVRIPVIAAGGIADGRGVAAAFALGASGVQVGTRFVVAKECEAHPAYKRMIIDAGDRDTVVTGLSTGHPVRVLRNRFAREFLEKERLGTSKEELARLGEGKLAAAVLQGDVEGGSVMAGQCAGLVKREQPAAEIIKELFEGAQAVFAGIKHSERGEGK
ncbi:MAG TPA: enoyl-[acyl-carrier-protein] reductase FabK [Firmicutes bacterium]|nr:enoyl-[acyl-carrier-protein] reductase FabK [Bacillota bacterium]